MIENIHDEHFFFTFDPHGRFHNNYTNLKKEIRNTCLKIDGKELDNFDIKSSQPLFFVQILKENYAFNNPEINTFIDLVENHNIYIYFRDHCPSLKNDRNKAKRLMLITLFDPNNSTSLNRKLFKYHFPTVFDFIETYERNYHEPLWKTLQRHESNFIYNNIY
jgi:hypothetical protein